MGVGDGGSQRLCAVVTGVVQGVSFRFHTLRQAESLGLKGWVANRRDGNVETVAEGPRGSLDAFLAYLHQGPASAAVSQVVFRWEEATGEFDGFRVVYL